MAKRPGRGTQSGAKPFSGYDIGIQGKDNPEMNKKNFSNLIAFWRSVEALSPQTIPKLAPDHKDEPVSDWRSATLTPWSDPAFSRRPIPDRKAWRHTVYAATYERAAFIKALEDVLGRQPGVFEQRTSGKSCVFTVAFDEHGHPQPDTFSLGMAAWACGLLVTRGLDALTASESCDTSGLHTPEAGKGAALPPSNTGVPGFDSLLDALRADLAWRLGNLPENHPPEDLTWFDDFVQEVLERCQVVPLAGEKPVHRVRSFQMRRPAAKASDKDAEISRVKGDDDLLNSFFIRDLNRIHAVGFAGAGDCLRRFLEPPAGMAKTDVRRDRRRALELLDPARFPEGCWPAEHPLVWSQQLAVNTLWRDLAGGTGVFAVNGPPGTGKTTLLRDVVAAVIVERAKVLAEGGGQLLGGKSTLELGGRSYHYHPLDKRLAGFSVVVASSNNGAVENVSLELPKANAIDDIWAGKSQAFPDLASVLIEQPAWALIAGRLGNKENRNDFVGRFWWQSTAKGATVAGMRERLEDLDKGRAAPALSWDSAVKAFQRARAAEADCRKQLASLPALPVRVATLISKKAEAQADQLAAGAEKATATAQRDSLNSRVEGARTDIQRAQQRIERQLALKPGILDWLITLGRSHREWRVKVAGFMDELRQFEEAESAMRRQSDDIAGVLARVERRLADLEREIRELNARIDDVESRIAAARALLGEHWPDLDADEEAQERSSPWAYKKWRQARIRVFLAALDVHRAFLDANAWKMRNNLDLAMLMLGTGVPDAKARGVALDSLAIACPVISTTFASVPSLFGDLGPGSIGWLLIDEAGQATPQAAAGAIWRARRAVVVGDPLQLEPVVTLPRTVEAALAVSNGNVDRRWHPNCTSVQCLADATTPTGTAVGGDGEDSLWVGAPLRVHRRCDEPMFSVSNRVAYDGMMVHQKKPAALGWPASGWIDVPRAPASGNWISAEGEALRGLLRELRAQGVPAGEIFLISPFRDVVRELAGIGRAFKLDPDRVGTVHTTQGKEAEVVILVLGGGTACARDWAAEKPNLLNVAVSRAKARLYVIGDRADWGKRSHFDVLVRELGKAAAGDAKAIGSVIA